MGKKKEKKYYAYLLINENISGIVESWNECQNLVTGYKARYKSFSNLEEAQYWLENGAEYSLAQKMEKEKIQSQLEEGIYFDAGTGRGIGVEVRVTDVEGTSLLNVALPSKMINEFGNYLTREGSTNNYGELIGLYLAIDIANKLNIKKIFGDSKLVIEYWSKGKYHPENLNDRTINLIRETIKKRVDFEKNNGFISYVSGGINPADLGFHK